MNKLTKQEEEVMQCIWRFEGCTVKEAMSLMNQPLPPYTTVASIVKNLERKGYVSARKVGNTYLYTPAIAEKDYKRSYLGTIVEDYFQNSYKEMVTFFARDNKISSEDLKEIIDLIENGKDTGKPEA